MSVYTIKKSSTPLVPGADPSAPQWKKGEFLTLGHVFDQSSSHKPKTQVRLLHDDRSIAGLFQVCDRYVIGKATADQQPVCKDSCVEFFFQVQGDERYFNLEMSCTGRILLYHVRDCRGGDFEELKQCDLDMIIRKSSLPEQVLPEITTPTDWWLSFYIPVAMLEKHTPVGEKLSGQIWRGNFTKCADDSSHPHWISWLKLSKLDFHLPKEFGELVFE